MSIDGYDGGGRILTHSGAGTLSITGLTVIHGYEYEVGGCVRSSGNLALDNVDVRYCTSVTYDTTSYVGGGGGVFVAGNLTMSRSAIAGNLAVAGQLGRAFGGGAYVLGSVDIRDSAITGNYVAAGSGLGNIGGITIVGRAPSTIVNSTISDNAAANNVGGIYAYSQLTLSLTAPFRSTRQHTGSRHPAPISPVLPSRSTARSCPTIRGATISSSTSPFTTARSAARTTSSWVRTTRRRER